MEDRYFILTFQGKKGWKAWIPIDVEDTNKPYGFCMSREEAEYKYQELLTEWSRDRLRLCKCLETNVSYNVTFEKDSHEAKDKKEEQREKGKKCFNGKG